MFQKTHQKEKLNKKKGSNTRFFDGELDKASTLASVGD